MSRECGKCEIGKMRRIGKRRKKKEQSVKKIEKRMKKNGNEM